MVWVTELPAKSVALARNETNPVMFGCATVAVRFTPDVGRIGEAREALQRAVAIKESAFGPDYVKVAIALSNLDVVDQVDGRTEAGLAGLRRALWIAETVDGPAHPRVVNILNSLGVAQSAAGMRDEAVATLRRACEISEATLGPEHPRTGRKTYVRALTDAGVGMRRGSPRWRLPPSQPFPHSGQPPPPRFPPPSCGC